MSLGYWIVDVSVSKSGPCLLIELEQAVISRGVVGAWIEVGFTHCELIHVVTIDAVFGGRREDHIGDRAVFRKDVGGLCGRTLIGAGRCLPRAEQLPPEASCGGRSFGRLDAARQHDSGRAARKCLLHESESGIGSRNSHDRRRHGNCGTPGKGPFDDPFESGPLPRPRAKIQSLQMSSVGHSGAVVRTQGARIPSHQPVVAARSGVHGRTVRTTRSPARRPRSNTPEGRHGNTWKRIKPRQKCLCERPANPPVPSVGCAVYISRPR